MNQQTIKLLKAIIARICTLGALAFGIALLVSWIRQPELTAMQVLFEHWYMWLPSVILSVVGTLLSE